VLPAVNEDYRATCIFFMLFMVIVVVWLLNLCLATVFQQYRSFVHKRFLHRYETRRNALLCAFILLDLDGDRKIQRDDFLKAVKQIKNLPADAEDELDFMWSHCDVDSDGVLDGGDFFHICDVLVCNVQEQRVSLEHVVVTPYDDGFRASLADSTARAAFHEERRAETLYHRFRYGGLLPPLRVILVTPLFKYAIISCILGSNIILIYTANLKLSSNTDAPLWTDQIEIFFVSFFVLEMIIKILAVGFTGYIKTPWWKFDMLIAFASALGIVLEAQSSFDNFSKTSVPLRMAKVLRTVRLIRVVSRVKKFRMIVGTSTKFFPTLPRFLFLFIVLLYVYMIVGIETFGVGSIEEWRNITDGTSYASMIYEIPGTADTQPLSYVDYVNFQTPQNCLIMLFSLLMVNNWHILHDAVEVSMMRRFENNESYNAIFTDPARWFVSVYFVSFHIIAVIVVMNLLVSIFLDRYLTEWQKAKFQDVKKITKYRSVGSVSSRSFSSSESASAPSVAISDSNCYEEENFQSARSRNFRTLADDAVLVCHTCEATLHRYRNPSVECEVTRKVCCRKCCVTCIEPRLDYSLLLRGSSGGRVGYEPVSIEKKEREKLIKMWNEDRLLNRGEENRDPKTKNIKITPNGDAFFDRRGGSSDYASDPDGGNSLVMRPISARMMALERDVDELVGRNADNGDEIGIHDRSERTDFEAALNEGAEVRMRKKSRLSVEVDKVRKEERISNIRAQNYMSDDDDDAAA
jgi:Ca2+-binding EF-hand superfamily protein